MNRSVTILLADDDPDDRMLVKQALERSRLSNPLAMVSDGVELMEYLNDPQKTLPGLILLDLNMPRVDGRQALSEIKKDDRFKRIPVIILTTSESESDISNSYDLGVNAYLTKPVTFDGLVKVVQTIGDFWFMIASLPPQVEGLASTPPNGK